MIRTATHGLLAAAFAVAISAQVTFAQTVAPDPNEGVNAADYIREQLNKPDPSDRIHVAPLTNPSDYVGRPTRAGNQGSFQRSTVFDGRRTDQLQGTGLHILPQRGWRPNRGGR